MWDMSNAELMAIVLLNSIHDKAMMIKVQERIDDHGDWQQLRNLIILLDRANAMSSDYLTPKSKNHSYSV